MECSGLRIAAMPDFVTGVQRRALTVWKVVVTVTVLLLFLFCSYCFRCYCCYCCYCSWYCQSFVVVAEGFYLRTAFFWVIKQRVLVICYRRFGTTYRYILRV